MNLQSMCIQKYILCTLILVHIDTMIHTYCMDSLLTFEIIT